MIDKKSKPPQPLELRLEKSLNDILLYKLYPSYPIKSLRDEFAMAALSAIVAKLPLQEKPRGANKDWEYKIALGAYSYADAMIRARNEE